MSGGQNSQIPKARILIIEDETPVAMMMVNALTRAGCDVLVASTGKKGMELAKEAKFDLIVLDTDLPDADGIEVYGELKQRHASRHIPIVVFSRCPCEGDQQRVFKPGVADYIAKPFNLFTFVSRLLSHVNFTTFYRKRPT